MVSASIIDYNETVFFHVQWTLFSISQYESIGLISKILVTHVTFH